MRKANLLVPETATQVLVAARQDWLLSTLVPFQFSETVVIFQDMFPISTAAPWLVYPQFPLEVLASTTWLQGQD